MRRGIWQPGLCLLQTLLITGCGIRFHKDHASSSASSTGLSCADLGGGVTYDALGAGTPSNPYLICVPAQLAHLSATPAAWKYHFKLGADLSMSAYNQTSFTPIGSTATPFSGTFDGADHAISSFTYTDGTRDDVGLFGYVAGTRALVRRVRLTGANVLGRGNVGILAGRVGDGATVSRCSVAGTVDATNSDMGGLVGWAQEGVVISASEANVTLGSGASRLYWGGLVGYVADSAWVINSRSTGTLTVWDTSGGLVGESDGVIVNSYSDASVNGTSGSACVGGLVGRRGGTGQIRNSFAAGVVSGDDPSASVGLLVGCGGGSNVTNSFRYALASCTNSGGGGCNTDGTAEPSIANLRSSSSAPLSSWSFTDVWVSSAGAFPTLNPRHFDPATWNGCAAHASDTPYAGGSGTVEDPYRICTAAQFAAIGTRTADWSWKVFRLMADIDLTGYNSGNFTLIGTNPNYFSSIFDGGGRSISNFSYSSAPTTNLGLFRQIQYAIIRELGVVNPTITGNDSVGGLAGSEADSFIANVFVKGGTITGSNMVGGIVADISNGYVRNSYTTATISAGWSGGGAIGEGFGGLARVFARGNVTVGGGGGGPLVAGGAAVGSYFDSSKTCASCNNTAGVGVDTSLPMAATYFFSRANAPLSGWDFDNIWSENATDTPSLIPE